MGLIFDTSELIRAERLGSPLRFLIDLYGPDEDYGVSVMSIAELQHGVRRAETHSRFAIRERFLQNVVDAFDILPMTESIALRVGDLDAELEMRGATLAIPDIIIAATAMDVGYGLATHNLDHFRRIHGLRLESRDWT